MPFSSIPQIKLDCPAGSKGFPRGLIFMTIPKQHPPKSLSYCLFILFIFSHHHLTLLFTYCLQPPEQAPSLSCPWLHFPCSEQSFQMLVNENENTHTHTHTHTEELNPHSGMWWSNTETSFQSGWYSSDSMNFHPFPQNSLHMHTAIRIFLPVANVFSFLASPQCSIR